MCFEDNGIFSGLPLGVKTFPQREEKKWGLKDVFMEFVEWLKLTVYRELCQPCGKMIWYSIVFTWALSQTMFSLTR